MNFRLAAAALCLGVAFSSNASAFGFGLLGGCGGCAEPVCCDVEPSCGCEPSCCVAEPVCCDPCCAPRKCALLSGLKGLFHRHHACCEPVCCDAEPTCCAPEPSCCVADEPSCCVAEPTCGCEAAACCDPCCDPCCAPRSCKILDGLKNLFKRRGCCAPACCDVEPSCCVAEPSCGCEAAPSCGCGH